MKVTQWNGYENMGVLVNENGTDLGVNVFQTLHHLPEQPPDVVWTGDQLPRVYQLPQSLVLTVLHLSHDSHMTHEYLGLHLTILLEIFGGKKFKSVFSATLFAYVYVYDYDLPHAPFSAHLYV